MKGFKLKINDKHISAGVGENGVFSVFINCLNNECHITVFGTDHTEGKKYVWENVQIEFGQSIEFEFTDIDSVSVPVKMYETEVMSVDDIKLESYRKIKIFLKQEGIL